MTKVKDIAAIIEEAVPLELQEGYDNSGLIVGHPDAPVSSALICVDITEKVMDEAEKTGADMIISHHPVIFHPLKHITGGSHTQRVVERAIQKGIALYAAHTNLDAVKGGMSHKAAQMLGLVNVAALDPSPCGGDGNGVGITGELPEKMAAVEFLWKVKELFKAEVVRHSDLCFDTVSRIAVCTGSGASLMEAAVAAGAEVYIAADFKYNNFLDADKRIIIADIGHFESEYCAIDLLYDVIRKKIATFALHKSRNSRNPVNYLV